MILSQSKNCSDFSSSEFLYAVSHELRNPLNLIIGFSNLLRLEIKKSKIPDQKTNNSLSSFDECMDCINEINQAAYEMNELIHDLLDVGSISSGNFSIDLSKEIDIKDLIRRSVKLNHDQALNRKITLKSKIDEAASSINLDAKRMKQILANLISNAVKYSPENTEIKISAKNIFENNRKFLRITVVDQGFGMTQSQVQTAFVKYKTFKNPNSGKVDSFGLGLPIVKQLVELQNGTIEIRSALNQGTEIGLRFPY